MGDGAEAPAGRGARGEVVWSPPADAWATSNVGRFGARLGFDDFASLLAWSLAEPDRFWAAVADDAPVRWHRPPDGGVALADASMPGATWFPGATLNYAEHALRRAAVAPDEVAVVARSQSRDEVVLTWAELASQVARCAEGLRQLGVGVGDRVAAYAPNIAESLVALLATASIGAVWSSCAPEFGTRAVIDRFSQVEPVVLLAVDGYRYGDKVIDRAVEVDALAAALPSVRHVVGIRHLGTGPDGFGDLLASGAKAVEVGPTFEPVPFDHPLYVLYSSGTTGLPKAIVHGHGGITLEHLKALGLHHDLGPGDRFFWFSTTGWMMWNYLVSGLLVGATVVLFDGDPGAPDLGALWRLAHDVACTVFGTSAPFLMACQKAGIEPGPGRLRSVGSTGAPLPADGFRWVRDAVGVHVQVNSISGGTDVCTAYVGMVPTEPVRAGEITTRLLGCAVEAFDERGQACPPGTTGELVLTGPMPSMPVAFWGDDAERTRYRAAYFDDFPGVWRHGDWIAFDADGSCTITGRSDATLNRGGVRLGTSDFYDVVEGFPAVADSLVVHLEAADDDGGLGDLVLFVVAAAGQSIDDDVRAAINRALRTELSPRHVPDRIVAVPAVPRTLSGKKLELPVKRILQGAKAVDVASRDSLADPAALDHFESLA